MRITILIAATAVLAGCATAPANFEVQKTRSYAEPKDAVWERAVEWFAARNMPIKTIEKDSGIIASERLYGQIGAQGQMGDWADCGKGALEVPVRQKVDLNVFVRSVGTGSTATVNTNFSETRRDINDAMRDVDCNSTGKLEADILLYMGTQ